MPWQGDVQGYVCSLLQGLLHPNPIPKGRMTRCKPSCSTSLSLALVNNDILFQMLALIIKPTNQRNVSDACTNNWMPPILMLAPAFLFHRLRPDI